MAAKRAQRMHTLGSERTYLRNGLSALSNARDRYVMRWLSSAVAFVVAGSVFAGASPYALQLVIDQLSMRRANSYPLGLVATVIAYVVLLTLQRTCDHLQVFAFAKGERRLSKNFASFTFLHVMHLQAQYFVARGATMLSSTVNLGLHATRTLLYNLTIAILPLFVQVIVTVAFVSHVIGLEAGAVLVCAACLYALVFSVSARALGDLSGIISKTQIAADSFASDRINNVELFKSFNAEKYQSDRFSTLVLETERSWRKFANLRLVGGLAMASIFFFAVLVLHLLALPRPNSGGSPVGNFVLMGSSILLLVRPIEVFGFSIQETIRACSQLARLGEIFSQPVELPSSNQPTLAEGPAYLSFRKVSLSFGKFQVLKDVSFLVERGRTLAIVGASGSGKTSVARLIMRYLEPDGGEILFNGRPLNSYGHQELRSLVGLMSQETPIVQGSLHENVSLGDPGIHSGQIFAAARMASLDGLFMHSSGEAERSVGERGAKLSGGERQKIGLARMSLKKAAIFIFDEPTAALDIFSEREVLHSIENAFEGHTKIIISHRLALVSGADNIVVLAEGRVSEQGRHHSLMRLDGLYASMWKAQSAEIFK